MIYLYHSCRLTVVFLAFDIFFIIFCVGMVCIVFFALFCFIPIVALAYAMRIREGASEEDIRSLTKYKFSQSNLLVMVDDSKKQGSRARMDANSSNQAEELYLNPDDSVSTVSSRVLHSVTLILFPALFLTDCNSFCVNTTFFYLKIPFLHFF